MKKGWADNPMLVEPADGGGAYSGITLRDLFAAAALTGLIVNSETCHPTVPISARAYELADAMLVRRKG